MSEVSLSLTTRDILEKTVSPWETVEIAWKISDDKYHDLNLGF